ncbi:hypothetical protein CSKR_200900 [Clonorchis sinensis]|uniref:Uncharacterized protein n=1 Tax=Clonorchis sinensis TaxID=79923 RepID=A0A8T1MJ54_CLOSI|nr:hypothetical protein CSKR_200900 [Clonorchis sinensis]
MERYAPRKAVHRSVTRQVPEFILPTPTTSANISNRSTDTPGSSNHSVLALLYPTTSVSTPNPVIRSLPTYTLRLPSLPTPRHFPVSLGCPPTPNVPHHPLGAPY